MRLASLTLESYGPFRRLDLAFATAPGVVNLVVAPNGRGKSVVRRAIGDLLFGIPNISPMAYLHGTQNMRLVASVEARDGRASRLVRRRGQPAASLSDGADRTIPLEDLRRLVGAVDAQLFRELFGLDTELLRQGGEALLKSEGRLGQVLFAGSGGLTRVMKTLDALEKQRDELGRAGHAAKGRPIWAAHEIVTKSERDLKNAALRPDAWAALERAASEAAARLAELRAEQASVNTELGRLNRSRAIRPHLAQRAAALARLVELADVPRLDDGFERRWRSALEENARAASAAAAASAHLERQRERAAGLALDDRLLAAGTAIDALAERAGVAAQAEIDLPGVIAKHQVATAGVARLRHELGWSDVVALPPLPAIRRAREHLKLWPGLAKALASAEHEAADAAVSLAEAEADHVALPPPADLAAVQAVLADLQPLGDPAALIAKAETVVRDARAALDKAVASIPELRIAFADLAAKPPPSAASLVACETGLAAAEAAARDAARVRDTLRRDIAELEMELATFTRAAAMPEPGALAAARARRDQLWDSLVRTPADPATTLAFERALREADAIADALVAHSAELADAEARRRNLADRRDAAARADADLLVATETLDVARDRFSRLAEATGATGIASPAILRDVLAARATALDRARDLDRATDAHATLTATISALHRRLAAALAEPPPETLDGLPGAIRRAADRTEADRKLRADHKQLADRVRERAAGQHRRAAAAAAAGRDAAAWAATWAGLAEALARPPDDGPAAADAALLLIEELRGKEAERSDTAQRIAEMRGEIDAFAHAVETARMLSGAEPTAEPPAAIARALAARLAGERTREARATQLHQELGSAEQGARTTHDAAEEAARHVASLLSALRVDSEEAAERQLQLARDAAAADRACRDAETYLFADGRPIAELESLVQLAAAETEAAEIERLSLRQSELSAAVEAAAAAARSTDEQRDRVVAETAAAAAAERRETGIAQLARATDEALLLHAAWSLLKAGLERQRGTSETRLLRRIGAVFRALTCGAHAGIALDESAGRPSVLALEADGLARKAIAGLSEGTRDQLYLALRIVALEEYAASEPPLPFIADDIFQTFDDERTEAGLRALVDLSVDVQVIALTHHPHVAGIAGRLGADAVRCLELPAEMVPAG